jgi:Xaa-Pro dipeptidase
MDLATLYRAHVETLQARAEAALVSCRDGGGLEGIVFHAGTRRTYHADDRDIAFHPVPHFARFVPVVGEGHLLLVKPGQKPKLAHVVPRDYWYEPPAQPDHAFVEVLDVVEVDSPIAAAAVLGPLGGCAYVGDDAAFAGELQVRPENVERADLLARLDYDRAFKTPYEVECMREAARRAGAGHFAVRLGVQEGWSERKLHARYLEATGMLEDDTPYTNIIAWDMNSAVLHYQSKIVEPPEPGHTFLIDAGATTLGYASDITRTYVREGVHPVFREALDRMEAAQRRLVAQVRPGQSYVELHERAHHEVAAILSDLGICRLSAEDTFAKGLTRPFLPHGLGHHLGVQVHDVGGRQVAPDGTNQPPPPAYPYLRTTRDLAEGHVVTIEPGLYFIPMLLEPLREGDHADQLDWDLVDSLIPCGGIRIEDDVLVTADGCEDLTRPFVPGHDGEVRAP